MQDIHLISQYIEIKNKKVFDIGCAGGKFADFFISKGAHVFAIDKIDNVSTGVKENSSFAFQEASIDTFETKEKFDIIFSRNVFPFCDSKLEMLLNKLNKNIVKGGVVFFTYFGDKEIWGQDDKIKTLKRLEIDKILEEYKNLFDLKYFAEEIFEGKTMGGGIKNWHIFRVILKKK